MEFVPVYPPYDLEGTLRWLAGAGARVDLPLRPPLTTEWTTERAERYMAALPVGARLFAVLVIDSGSVAVADLRTRLTSVRGCRTAHGFALRRGVREGWWPETIPEPITPVYDPADPHRHRAVAYEVAPQHRSAFHGAIARQKSHKDNEPRVER
ncbi:hypothetical protein OHS71_41210 (plasmid) [Streptomyces sp. NBC_00377]|uniref:hypothetical protein n=1 Tax=unclassified Streptomyces TaxID=2593676 RepID=UPI002E1F33B0|nr:MULTISPECIES: hypothetical protein [unclassified Streptomyces]